MHRECSHIARIHAYVLPPTSAMFMGRLQPSEVAYVHGQVPYSVCRLLADSIKGSYKHKAVIEKTNQNIHFVKYLCLSTLSRVAVITPSAREHFSDTSAS